MGEWAEYHLARPFGIELLDARYVTHSFMPHAHQGFALGVILDGAEQFRYRGQSVTAPGGSVVVVAPGETHTGHAAHPSGWVYRMAYPAAHWLEEAHEALGGRGLPEFGGSVLDDVALAHRLSAALGALHDDTDPLRAETLWRGTLEALVLRHGRAPTHRAERRERRAVAEARAMLDADPAGALSLSGLAAAVGLTPSVLSRSFRAEVGLAPHAYRSGLRVARARTLLLDGERLADIALHTGFADQAHFSRVFKRVVGVSPGHIQQRVHQQRPGKNIQDTSALRSLP
ncbi:helix-turn-helix domain-containing protein [Deinococcus alpinitundrae]|uniref:helix-turn-helix domain-containing protein n=1 Tax=Deinococcus alpinitundrae TaxID=468913 RepID=UPI00137B6DFA|nr:AraC family transcriptional regulator [Deinococcus alpinitundrae]